MNLKASFSSRYKQILSISYFLVLEYGMSMYRFHKWGLTHKHPFGEDIPSQRSDDLFSELSESGKMEFFRRQAKRRSEKEYLAFDTTSISSYSELIHLAKYGKNKEGDDLPQINLALLYGEISRLPVYYRKLAGNTADVSTIKNLIRNIDFLQMEKLSFVLDRGFFSEANINDLMKHHHIFLIGARLNLKIVKKHLDAVRGDKLISWENYHDDIGLYVTYVTSFTEEWDYHEDNPRTGESIDAKRRVYVHLYFNAQRCTDERVTFSKYLTRLQRELESGNRKEDHEEAYQRFFEVHETPKRGMKVIPKEDAIRRKQKDFGYFALISNGIKEAIRIYRTRDLAEKSFANLKERLDMRRMSVFSAENFEGKLFVQFVALMHLSYIKKMMEKHDLYRTIRWTSSWMKNLSPEQKELCDRMIECSGSKDKYGQTLVFSLNQTHAISLTKLFNKAGIPADYVISGTREMFTGASNSSAENERKKLLRKLTPEEVEKYIEGVDEGYS
ncbi:MAG: transposase [Bilifractor sp.]